MNLKQNMFPPVGSFPTDLYTYIRETEFQRVLGIAMEYNAPIRVWISLGMEGIVSMTGALAEGWQTDYEVTGGGDVGNVTRFNISHIQVIEVSFETNRCLIDVRLQRTVDGDAS